MESTQNEILSRLDALRLSEARSMPVMHLYRVLLEDVMSVFQSKFLILEELFDTNDQELRHGLSPADA
jgi:hypothetical protein